MTPSPNSTAHWMFVDLQQIEQPLTRKDRQDLARYGSEILIKRLWIRTAVALTGCAVAIATALLVLTGPVAVCLSFGAGLLLLALAAADASRVRRIQAALNVEFVIRNDALDLEHPRVRPDRIDLPAVARGTVGPRQEGWRGRRARH